MATPLGNRYRYAESIRSGDRAIAWLVEDETTGRKLVAAPIGTNRVAGYESIRGVSHVHLAAIVDVVRAPDASTIPEEFTALKPSAVAVAEWVPGRTLHERMKAGPMTHREAVTYIVGVVHATAELHERKLPHGAISPRTIIVEPTVARASPVLVQLAAPTSGTYSSRERLQRRGASLEDDSWALHATLYSALTGVAPFAGLTREELIKSMLAGEPKKIGELGVQAPEIEELLARGLVHNPRWRPSVADLGAALERWLAALADDDHAQTVMVRSALGDAPPMSIPPVPHYDSDSVRPPPTTTTTPTPKLETPPPVVETNRASTPPAVAKPVEETPPAAALDASWEPADVATTKDESGDAKEPSQSTDETDEVASTKDEAKAIGTAKAESSETKSETSSETRGGANLKPDAAPQDDSKRVESKRPEPATAQEPVSPAKPATAQEPVSPAKPATAQEPVAAARRSERPRVAAQPATAKPDDDPLMGMFEQASRGQRQGRVWVALALAFVLVGSIWVIRKATRHAPAPSPAVTTAAAEPAPRPSASSSAEPASSVNSPDGVASAAAPVESAAPTRADPTKFNAADRRSCVAGLLGEGSLTPDADIEPLCGNKDLKGVAALLTARLMVASRGRPTAPITEWQDASWFQLAISAVVRAKCCGTEPAALPKPRGDCEPLDDRLRAVVSTASNADAAAVDSFEAAVRCFYAKGVPRPFPYAKPIKGPNRAAFERFRARLRGHDPAP